MERLGMIVDAAHASSEALEDLIATARRPFLVSHAGVQGVCPGPRNLSDEQLRRVAARGGLVGIGFWRDAVGDVSPTGVARSIRHAVRVAGAEHVALGSDWDGAVTVGFEASALSGLTAALLEEGLPEDQIRGVMGENALRFLLAALPPPVPSPRGGEG
jgi:microsomal dipeptidase-like Zn-dependent dipeptidase